MKPETITLKAKSPKGDKLIHRYGSKWLVLKQQAVVPCLGNRSGIWIKSGDHTEWMAIPDEDDRNFSIVY